MPTTKHSLYPLFHPQSIAVVGASTTPGSVGSILMRNLMANPFGGVVYPVNPKRRSVHGVLCYPSIPELPEVPDLAIIATPAATVPATIQDCVNWGIKGAIIISAGFSEMGDLGKGLERQIRDIARGKMRIIGPNCLGVIAPYTNLNASFASSMARPGRVALLSQSGAILTAILDWARESHIGFSAFVSMGTMLDVDFADLLDYFGDDPNTRSIVLYMESVGDVRKFFSAARAVARTKQVIVVKAGRHEAAAKAAASHTGALAGSDAVFDAAIRRAGLLRVNTIPDMFEMAEILSSQVTPRGPNLAIITNAGGPGVMATDALMSAGGQLAPLGTETRSALDAVLPPFWSHSNPIDVLGDAGPLRYRQAIDICAKDPAIQGILVLLTPQAMTDPTETARQLLPFAHLEKPLLASWMGGPDVRAGESLLSEAGIPTYHSPESAVRAFMNMVQYRRNQEQLYQRPEALPPDWAPDQKKARAILQRVRDTGRTLLDEFEAKLLLSAYGIPTVQTAIAVNPDTAATIAARLGFPVVLKLWSKVITHKSDAGGVQLNLASEQEVRAAFQKIKDGAETYARQHNLQGDIFGGVTVQPMIKMKGYELIIGSSVDMQFGPTILFGAGGILVEVFQDRALGLPPLNRPLARRLIESTQIHKALQGVRGQGPIPFDQLEMLLVRFSYLLCDFLDIQEIDINPLVASPEGLLALDARVLLCPADLPADRKPRLTIEPYPNQYTTTFTAEDGQAVIIRALRPEDEGLIEEHHATLTEKTIRMRFFSMVKLLSRDSLIRLCHLDYAREMALAAERIGNDGKPFLMGVARYYMHPETRAAEFAVVISDRFQGLGLGRHLMERLIDVARQRGVKTLVGLVLRENSAMLGLAKELGFTIPEDTGEESIRVELQF